jgi:transposase
MSRRTEAPIGFDCPYRHNCPHLEQLSCSWALEVYQEADELRRQLYALEERHRQEIAELHKTLLERDRTIAALRLEHQKHFKPHVKRPQAPVKVKGKRRGAPLGHPGWHRREPDHIDQTVAVPAPENCPHCQHKGLEAYPEAYEHVQEDIILVPRTFVVRFVHEQGWCPKCRRAVYQRAEGEVRGCQIGPVTRAPGPAPTLRAAGPLSQGAAHPQRPVRHAAGAGVGTGL